MNRRGCSIPESYRVLRERLSARVRSGSLRKREVREFQSAIYDFYAEHRRELPWRKTKNGYRILVSEVMLQQTQVNRVQERYHEFLRTFPTPRALAQASLPEVIRAWQGLGYNRRAIALKRTAEALVERFAGKLPSGETELLSLPGIGPYTAAALGAFVFNRPTVVVETNIRTVMIFFFLAGRRSVSPQEIADLVQATVDLEQPGQWYQALMDFGAELKRLGVRTNGVVKGYVKQAPFSGSNREVRGAIIRELAIGESVSRAELARRLGFSEQRFSSALEGLRGEGLVAVGARRVSLRNSV